MRWKAAMVVVIGVAISASITLFLRRAPGTASRLEVSASAPPTLPPPAPAPLLTPDPERSEPTAPESRPPAQPPTPIHDVGWLLVGVPDNGPPERWHGIAENIQSAHERLAQMPDDPAWSRRAESELRVALTSVPMEKLTSVVCRAGGCEVQAALLDPGAMSRRLPRLPPAISEANPLPDLSMDATERSLLVDRWGIYLSYRRVE